MKQEWPPEENKDEKRKHGEEQNFEKIKTEFSLWIDLYLNHFYENGWDTHSNFFDNPVEKEIKSLGGEEEVTNEKIRALTVIFGEKLISFCNNIIFSKNYDKFKTENFYYNLRMVFFVGAPNIFENLDANPLQKIILLSEINETYALRNLLDISVEIAYDLTWLNENHLEDIKEGLKKLTIPQKISTAKQLSRAAMAAYENGSWAYPAFKKIIDIISEVLEAEDKPIISFVLDNELKKINSFASDLDDFEDDFGNGNLVEVQNEDILRLNYQGIENNILKESSVFFKNNQTILDTEKIAYTNVSVDYGSIIIPGNQMPFALVKKSESNLDNKGGGGIVPIRSYNGITKEKELNPLGTEDFSYLVKILHSPEIRDYINNRLNIKIEFLLLREQIYFLQFLASSDDKKFNKMQTVLNNKEEKHNMNLLRSFLSMSGSVEMGDKILSLGEKLPEEVAQKVFAKYGQIIDNVNKITEFAKTNFTKEIETNSELISKIETTLYERGKSLLTDVYNEISNEKEVNYEEIEKDLERINADTITTLAIFKQAVKNGEKLPVESIEGAIFAKEEAKDIEEKSQEEMSLLYDKNYKDYPDQKFFSKVKEYFNTAFVPENNKQKNYFYTFKKDNHTRAFVRFEKKEDTSLYASALNVDDASKNFGLGEAMMDEALIREAKEHILHATCLTDRPSNMRYFEKGFISKELERDENTIQLKLVWDEKRNKKIMSKQMSMSELVSLYNNKEEKGSIEIKESDSLESLHRYIPEEKALVRCFLNKENNKWYAVYEKVDNDYGLTSDEDE